MEVLIARTGTANVASVLAGLRRAGANPVLCADPDALRHAERVVLPGVGALAPAMSSLRALGVDAALAERLEAGRPTLGICLGMQIWLDTSDESPGIAGLGAARGHAARFPDVDGLRVPHLGWNRVAPGPGSRLRPGYAYFAHSFRLSEVPPGWTAAWTEHGGRFVSAIERGDALACQFHPELSGAWGVALLQRWLEC